MKYQSKKNPEIIASLYSTDEKTGNVILVYETGETKGKSVSITSSTLKRWWKKVSESDIVVEPKNDVTSVLNIDYDKVNEPYPEPTEQKYVPKPDSVIEYEAKKNKKYNYDLPDFDTMVENLEGNLKKINNKSSYVWLLDGTTIWRKQSIINIYAKQEIWEKFTNKGLQSKPNKDKDRPYAFDIHNMQEYTLVLEALND